MTALQSGGPHEALMECLANVSEGRDPALLQDLEAAITAAGARMIDRQADADQHRAILRFGGRPAAVRAACLALAELACRRIDLRGHQGSHPRIGAVDLLPLVPLAGMSLDQAVDEARALAAELAERLQLPVYLAGDAALLAERRDLAALREGEYEGLGKVIATDQSRWPDFGPRLLGPAGACIVSARPPRIHLAIDLAGLDQAAAAAVAEQLDSATGPLQGLECRLVEGPSVDQDADLWQLALSLVDPERLPLALLVDWAHKAAGAQGGRLAGLRLLGPVPRGPLLAAAVGGLGLSTRPRIIEDLLLDGAAVTRTEEPGPLGDFLDRLAAPEATPGGGSVAALAAAIAAALAAMVAGLTIGRERYAAEEARMLALRGRADALRLRLEDLVRADAGAFEAVMAAYRLPRESSAEAASRRDAIQTALRAATQVPLDTLAALKEVMSAVLDAAAHGNASAASDAGVAGYLGLAAARAAALNAEINVLGLRDLEEGDRLRRQAQQGLREAEAAAEEVERRVRARMAGGA